MQVEALKKAMAEAERFITAAKKVEIVHKKFEDGTSYDHLKYCSKEAAACKRASLDLTRALAQMRRP